MDLAGGRHHAIMLHAVPSGRCASALVAQDDGGLRAALALEVVGKGKRGAEQLPAARRAVLRQWRGS